MEKPHQINISGLSHLNLSQHHSISAVNIGGGNDGVNAHAWWTNFFGLDPRFSALQIDPQCTLELEQGQKQDQEQLFVVKLSDATSLQVQIEPLDMHL